MCQKAVAGPFAVLAEVPWTEFAWTRGEPSTFQSSSRAVRDFCAACGTPLSYRKPGGAIIELMTGAFDQPARVAPTYEVGVEFEARLARPPCRHARQDHHRQRRHRDRRRNHQLPAPRPRHRSRLDTNEVNPRKRP